MLFDFAVVIAVIVGLGELVKPFGMPKKFLPVFSLVLGLAASFFILNFDTYQESIMFGLMMGLSSSGLFDQTKIVKRGK